VKGDKERGCAPSVEGARTRYGRRRSLLRWARAPGVRARAPEGRRRRDTGREGRSGKNAIIMVERPGVKKGCESERLTRKQEEEGGD